MCYSFSVSRPKAGNAAYGGQNMEYPQLSITDLHRPTDCQFRFGFPSYRFIYFCSAFEVKKSLLGFQLRPKPSNLRVRAHEGANI